uniref:Secreted protein n=1 Tax=Haemonchus contortus TaxID=6289 RepID=A0A7I4YRN2_HAECO
SAESDMFFYIVCALFLLNAFTTEAAVTTKAPCVDRGGEEYCSVHTGSPDYICTNVMISTTLHRSSVPNHVVFVCEVYRK